MTAFYSSAAVTGRYRLSRRETIALLPGTAEAGSRKDVGRGTNLGSAVLRLDEFVGDGADLMRALSANSIVS